MLAFDHVGLVTRDVDKAIELFGQAVQSFEATERFDDTRLTVSVRFLRDASGMIYEMIAPLGDNSVVSESLRRNKNIINQLAYRTPSIARDADRLQSQGFMLLGEALPALAFDGADVQFLMSPMGFMIELIEAPQHVHVFRALDVRQQV